MKWLLICLVFFFILCILIWSVPWLVTPVCKYPLIKMSAPKIRLLTYNTYLLGKKSRRKRLKFFLNNYLGNYDVVCLQEAFYVTHKLKIIRSAKALGFPFFAVSPFRYPIDSGLLILSRFPLLRTKFTPFHRKTHMDRYADKGILTTMLWVNDMHIQLINTHTQAFYNINDTKAFDVLGYQEIQIENEISLKGPVILCGDLNGVHMEDRTNLKRLTEELLLTGKMKFNKKGDEIVNDSDDNGVQMPFDLDTILYRELDMHNPKVEKFECPLSTSKLGHCSDHFGLSATICFDK